ncbi:flagellar export protein FliJ [Xylanimonas oleitrophica]|uniref:Flagellar FliJ protein n=1 Tax=Xylanimonas oleitrophica TaxID=2607479 RepID=A0A2W5WRI4_9MICO|nr:flagellar FliJ family protein [Xylanimonas oleitrophica]PZR54129.1 flagellar export protein FliJ [Xylanimonas oleitrophica]
MSRAFPLAGLLRVRGLERDSAAAALARAQNEAREADQRARAAREALYEHEMPATSDAQTWQAQVASRAALLALLDQSRDIAARRQAETEERRHAWNEARGRVRVVERLHDRHREAQTADELRAEQNVLDEIAGRTAPGPSQRETP